MAVLLVEPTQLIEVDDEHTGETLAALGPRERLVGPLREQRAVGQSGLGVVEDRVLDALGGLLGLLDDELVVERCRRALRDDGYGVHVVLGQQPPARSPYDEDAA